jgi:Zn-finger nucleic acid-binding protein
MACCPACDTEIDVDEFDVDRDDELSCPECGSNLVVTAVAPVELDRASGDDAAGEWLQDDDEQAKPFH